MKRSLAFAAVVCMVATAGVASAQAAKTVSIGISGGLSMPMGDLSNVAESGYNITGHYFYRPANAKRVLYRGDVSFDAWGANTTVGTAVLSGSLRSIGFMGNVVISAGDRTSSMRPYLLVGGGLARTSATYDGAAAGFKSSDTNLGVQGGAGLEFSLSGMSTFLEAKYVYALQETSDWTYVPITFGIRF